MEGYYLIRDYIGLMDTKGVQDSFSRASLLVAPSPSDRACILMLFAIFIPFADKAMGRRQIAKSLTSSVIRESN